MIPCDAFFSALQERGVAFFAGVPDSLLSAFCAYVADNTSPEQHIIAANEGNAVAIAMGRQISTGSVPVVYMQNSGLGNTVNPLVSLADRQVYAVPMLLIVGWRGEPEIADEPQHVRQGQITPDLLSLLGIPYRVLHAHSDYEATLDYLMSKIGAASAPAALLIRKGTFSPYKTNKKAAALSTMRREAALDVIFSMLEVGDAVVATTGKTSREVFELRESRGEPQQDFLTVGGMGHTSSIALGIALGRASGRVVCLDGDGSALMHLGAMPIIGSIAPSNFVHVLLNNASHESVGGQPTVAGQIDFGSLALAMGYTHYESARDPSELASAWRRLDGLEGPILLEVMIQNGARSNLGRPTSAPIQNKHSFTKFLSDTETT